VTRELSADPAQLDELGRRFDLSAQTLAAIGSTVSARLTHAEWFGQDAEQARYDWQSYYHGRFINLADLLRELAQTLHRNATSQRQTSDDPGGFGSFGDGIMTLPYLVNPRDLHTFRDPFPNLDSVIEGILAGLGLAGLAEGLDDLAKHLPSLRGLVKLIPEDLITLGKQFGPIGDIVGIVYDASQGQWDGVLLGVTSLGLLAVGAVAVAVGSVPIAIAAGIGGLVIGAVELAPMAGRMIGPAVEAISGGIADGVDAIADVAAPVIEGAKEFAGDVVEAGGQVLNNLNPLNWRW
jgi:uncharacterized protein YukE